jgi:hypothetical protein
MSTLLTGVCRAVFPWTDNAAILNIAFGTHSRLQVWQGGALYDITPYGPPTLLGTNPLTVHNGTARVDVAQTAHGRTTGDQIDIEGVVAVGGITPARHRHHHRRHARYLPLHLDRQRHLGCDRRRDGHRGHAAGSPIGWRHRRHRDGWLFDGGLWDRSLRPNQLATDYFPRTWSLAAWGQQLLANPRNGGLYQWTNNTAAGGRRAERAPTQITDMLVAPMNGGYMAFALGCNQEADGVFNPMVIRHSSGAQPDAVVDTRQRLHQPRIRPDRRRPDRRRPDVRALYARLDERRPVPRDLRRRPEPALALRSRRQQLRPDRTQGRGCRWPDGLLGEPGPPVLQLRPGRRAAADPECPIRTDYSDNLTASQGDKVYASACAEFSEVRWDYPDKRDGYENSRFVRLCVSGPDAGAWSGGIQARTAYVDAGPTLYPVGVTFGGQAYYHEKGQSADGSPFSWFIRTADQQTDPDGRLLVKQLWPDFKDQVGPVSVTLYSREHPQQAVPTVVTANPMSPDDATADFMISGRLFQVEFSGSSAPTYMRLGVPTFEAVPAGRF